MRPASRRPCPSISPAVPAVRRLVRPEALAADPRPRVGLSLLTAGLERPLFAAATYATLWSLANSDAWQTAACVMVCYDNGSRGGGHVLGLLEHFGAEVIKAPENLGIAAGRNAVAQRLLAWPVDFLVEIHNDHVFPSASTPWLAPLLEEMATAPRLGAVGPGLVTSAGFFGSPRLKVNYQDTIPQIVESVSRACAAARARYAQASPPVRRGLQHPVVKRRQAIEEVGLYDAEQFPEQNFEDTDEVRRLENAGWQVGVCLRSWVYHHYALTRIRLGDHFWTYWQNRRAFLQRWPDARSWLREWDEALHQVYRV